MKNFLIGASVFTLLSFGAVKTELLTVKPAKASQTIVKDFRYQDDSYNIAIYIRTKIQEGWQLKLVEGTNNGQYNSTWIVVMEKY